MNKRFFFIPITGAILWILSSCSTTTTTNYQHLSANDYLHIAASLDDSSQNYWYIKATKRYIDSRQINNAQHLINELNQKPITPLEQYQVHLLQAQIYVITHQNTKAISLLNALTPRHDTLYPEDDAQRSTLLGKAYEQQGNIMASIHARTQLLSRQSGDDRKKTLLSIWLSLQTLSEKEQNKILTTSQSTYLIGWLQLNHIINQRIADSSTTSQQILTWQQAFPDHPANELLPSRIQTQQFLHTKTTHIALLLPLSGPYQDSGSAIRNGFFTAYYHWKKKKSPQPKISVYDTYHKDISTVYNQASKDGADFIVGPLLKNNIQQLIKKNALRIPTLALNTLTPPQQHNDNLYQFGLAPIDEIQQITERAAISDHRQAIIIAPHSSWGKNIETELQQQWIEKGGIVRQTLHYDNQKTLSTKIKQLLNVDQSYTRGYAIRSALRQKNVRIISRRRKDFNVIFLISQPNMGRQIEPLLKFYFAGDIPTYSLSSIYTGTPNPAKDKDLNDILFCDIPWVLKANAMHPSFLNTLQKQTQTLWPNSYKSNSKLYALGIDAYDVSINLPTMILLPDFGNKAATGTLYIDKDQHIYRALPWAQFSKGVPKLRS